MKIRLPADLKDRIEEAAKNSGRSMNAEITRRLEASILREMPQSEPISADQAKLLAEKALEDGYSTLLDKCLTQINIRARQGYNDCHVSSDFEDWEDGDDIDTKVIQPAKAELERMGYKVEPFDLGFIVKF
jgi:hypothetical protein